VLIFYADEFGDHSMLTVPQKLQAELKTGTSDFFVLTGVGVRDTSRKPLADALFKIKKKHFGALASQPWGDSEIKGRSRILSQRVVALAPRSRHRPSQEKKQEHDASSHGSRGELGCPCSDRYDNEANP